MKPLFALLVLTTASIAGDTFDDMLLKDGTLLKNVEVREVTDRGLKVTHKDGSGLIKTDQLPAEIKKRYGARIAAASARSSPVPPPETTAPVDPKAAKPAGIIPGLTPSAVVQLHEKLGLTTRALAGPAGNEWNGSLKDGTADIAVSAAGPGKDTVTLVAVTVVDTSPAPGIPRARAVLSSFAELPYAGAEPAKAKQWLSDNLNTDGAKATIGGVSFLITARAGVPLTRTLRISCP